MPAKGWRKPIVGNADDPEGLIAWALRYVEDRRVKGYSKHTLTNARGGVLMLTEWAHHRGVDRPEEVDRGLMEAYQRALFYARKSNGQPMTLSTQRYRLQAVRGYFSWLVRTGVIPFNPTSEVDLPRLERRLPNRARHQIGLALHEPGMTSRSAFRVVSHRRIGELGGLPVGSQNSEVASGSLPGVGTSLGFRGLPIERKRAHEPSLLSPCQVVADRSSSRRSGTARSEPRGNRGSFTPFVRGVGTGAGVRLPRQSCRW